METFSLVIGFVWFIKQDELHCLLKLKITLAKINDFSKLRMYLPKKRNWMSSPHLTAMWTLCSPGSECSCVCKSSWRTLHARTLTFLLIKQKKSSNRYCLFSQIKLLSGKEPSRDYLVSNLPRAAFVSKRNLFSIRALFITSSVKILSTGVTGVVFLSLQVYM